MVHDHLGPLKRMPKLNSAAASGRIERLGFGPARLRLKTLPPLLVGEGKAGYLLFVGRGPAVKLQWDATTTLSRVDWRGRVVEIEERLQRHLPSLYAGHGGGIRFELGPKPAVYRLTTVLRGKTGRKLGGFGFYIRLVAPTRKAQLALNAASYRPGDAVFGRIENFGTAIVRYGAPYAIERFDGSTWTVAPESPRGPWILPLYGAGPGEAGTPCSTFRIPAGMPPGHYRMTKEVSFEAPSFRRPSQRRVLTAEFDVLP